MAVTDFKVSVIGKKLGDRVVVEVIDPAMRKFLEENERFVFSTKTEKPIRVTASKPIATDLLPDVVVLMQRCADEMSDNKRGRGQLASQKQIDRVRQLADILDKRKDSVLMLPTNLESMTWTQIGRLISDLKTILIKEGMWDDKAKCEIEKG